MYRFELDYTHIKSLHLLDITLLTTTHLTAVSTNTEVSLLQRRSHAGTLELSAISRQTCTGRPRAQDRPRNSHNPLRITLQHLVVSTHPSAVVSRIILYVQWHMQQPHRNGCAVQCREEEGWELLFYPDLLLPVQMSSLRRLVRDPDGPKGAKALN